MPNVHNNPDEFLNQRAFTRPLDGITNVYALYFHDCTNIFAIVMLVVYCLGPGWVVDCKSSKEKVMDAGRNLHLQKRNSYIIGIGHILTRHI